MSELRKKNLKIFSLKSNLKLLSEKKNKTRNINLENEFSKNKTYSNKFINDSYKTKNKTDITKKSKKIIQTTPNQGQKMLKLRYHGVEKLVPFEEFINVRTYNKEKLEAEKDSLIQTMRQKKAYYKRQSAVFNQKILDLVSEKRENEIRNMIYEFQKEIREKRFCDNEKLQMLFKDLLDLAKNLNDAVTKDIDQRKSEIMDRIMTSVASTDYKILDLLDFKLRQTNDFFQNLNNCTFTMEKIQNNFEHTVEKIKILSEKNYKLRKEINKQKLKTHHITVLMKDEKTKINQIVSKINSYNINSAKNLINPNEKYVQLTENNEINKISKINLYYKNLFKKGFKTNNKLFKKSRNSNSYNSLVGDSVTTHINTNSCQRKKINKNELEEKLMKYTSEKNETDVSKINEEIEPNIYDKISFVLKKDIEIYNKKKIYFENKMKETIPDNILYCSLVEIIEKLRKGKDNKCIAGINNELLKNSMRKIPLQSINFRKVFIDHLIRNKNIFNAIKIGHQKDIEKYFNKNIFGAVKK